LLNWPLRDKVAAANGLFPAMENFLELGDWMAAAPAGAGFVFDRQALLNS
jgi:hypothetical protein